MSAKVADHIDIRTDFSTLDPEAYQEEVKERFALSRHPDVKEMHNNIETLKENVRQAFRAAADLKEQARAKEEEADTAAVSAQGDAETHFEEAENLREQANRKRKVAERKLKALATWIRDPEVVQEVGDVVDDPKRLLKGFDLPTRRRRDEVHQKAENELYAAYKQEMRNLLEAVESSWEDTSTYLDGVSALNKATSAAGVKYGEKFLGSVDVGGIDSAIQTALDKAPAENG